MRRLLPALLAAVSLGAVSLGAVSSGGSARAAQPVRLVQAFAAPEASPGATLRIAPSNPEQAKDPRFAVMASRLGEALERRGFNLRQLDGETEVVVLLDYAAWALPRYKTGNSPVNDPSYRALVVTAIDSKVYKETGAPKILWQTAVDDTGISANADKTIPRLILAAEKHFGANTTGLKGNRLADSCSLAAGLHGSHIAGACAKTDNYGALLSTGLF